MTNINAANTHETAPAHYIAIDGQRVPLTDEEKESYILQVRNVRSWAVNYPLMGTDEKRMILPRIIEKIL